MKLLKATLAATALFGMMVSGAHADWGDRGRDDGHRYTERRGYDHGWAEHRRDGNYTRYRPYYMHRHHRDVRPWVAPPPSAFWHWSGHPRHYWHDWR